jgi:hypothetical protein
MPELQQQQHRLIGPRVIENLPFLKRLCRCSSERSRWRLLRKASKDQLLSLVEISTNLLRPHCFFLTQRQKNRLAPFATTVRGLSRVRSESGARRYTIQRGGGGFFAALIAPILLEASRHLITKLVGGAPAAANGE